MKKFVYKNIFEFEEFRYKGPSTFDRMKTGIKNFLGVENKADREEFERTVQNLTDPKMKVYISDVIKIKDNVIYTHLAGKYIYVDKNPKDPEIRLRSKKLDLNNLDAEAEYLYGVLERLM